MPVNIFQPTERNKDQWCAFDVQTWFNFVVGAGWLPYWQNASRLSGEDLAKLMAHASKEGGLGFYKKHPDGRVPGDFDSAGNPKAFGLHQEHCYGNQTPEDLYPPEKNIPEAARRLVANRIGVKHFALFNHLIILPAIETELMYDAYNRGLTGELKAYQLDYAHPDAPTAGGDYYADIAARAIVIEQLLAAMNTSV